MRVRLVMSTVRINAGALGSRCNTATERGVDGMAPSPGCAITRGFGRNESGNTVGATFDVIMNSANTAAMAPVAAATVRQRVTCLLSAITLGGRERRRRRGGGSGISGNRNGADWAVLGSRALMASHTSGGGS